MKIRLAHELSESCEAWLGEELNYWQLKMLRKTAKALIALHEACKLMHHMDEHSDKHMLDHYK